MRREKLSDAYVVFFEQDDGGGKSAYTYSALVIRRVLVVVDTKNKYAMGWRWQDEEQDTTRGFQTYRLENVIMPVIYVSKRPPE